MAICQNEGVESKICSQDSTLSYSTTPAKLTAGSSQSIAKMKQGSNLDGSLHSGTLWAGSEVSWILFSPKPGLSNK
jgi:hypothetical protein